MASRLYGSKSLLTVFPSMMYSLDPDILHQLAPSSMRVISVAFERLVIVACNSILVIIGEISGTIREQNWRGST